MSRFGVFLLTTTLISPFTLHAANICGPGKILSEDIPENISHWYVKMYVSPEDRLQTFIGTTFVTSHYYDLGPKNDAERTFIRDALNSELDVYLIYNKEIYNLDEPNREVAYKWCGQITNGNPDEIIVNYDRVALNTASSLPQWVHNISQHIEVEGADSVPQIVIARPDNHTATPFFDANAIDFDIDEMTYSIIGGADAALFSIDSKHGYLNFITQPGYDSPTDTDANNEYEVLIQAQAAGDSIKAAVKVEIVPENLPPSLMFNSGVSTVPEKLSTPLPLQQNGIAISDANNHLVSVTISVNRGELSVPDTSLLIGVELVTRNERELILTGLPATLQSVLAANPVHYSSFPVDRQILNGTDTDVMLSLKAEDVFGSASETATHTLRISNFPDVPKVYVEHNVGNKPLSLKTVHSAETLSSIDNAVIKGISVSRDGQYLAAHNYATVAFEMFELTPSVDKVQKLSSTDAVFAKVESLLFSPEGHSLYVSSYSPGVYGVNQSTAELLELQSHWSKHDRAGESVFVSKPVPMAISPDGTRFYIAEYGLDAIAVYQRNLGTGELTFLSTFDIDPSAAQDTRITDLMFAADNNDFLFVASNGSNSFTAIEVRDDQLRITKQDQLASAQSMAGTSDGAYLFTTTDDYSSINAFKLDLQNGIGIDGMSEAITNTNWPMDKLLITPDDRFLIATEKGGSGIFLYEILHQVNNAPDATVSHKPTGELKLLTIAAPSAALAAAFNIQDTSGLATERVGQIQDIALSGDGRHLLVVGNEGDIYVLSIGELFTERAVPVEQQNVNMQIASNPVFFDHDSANIQSMVVELEAPIVSGEGMDIEGLFPSGIVGQGGGTGPLISGGNGHRLVFQGAAPLASYQEVLKRIKYINSNFKSSRNILVTINDGTSNSNRGVIKLEKSFNPPVIAGGNQQLFNLIRETGIEVLRADLKASDQDNQLLSWVITNSPANGTVALLSNTGDQVSMIYTPNEGFLGTDTFNIQVGDSEYTDTVEIKVNVSNTPIPVFPPVIEGLGSQAFSLMRTNGNETLSVVFNAQDADSETLTWQVAENPKNGAVTLTNSGAKNVQMIYMPNPNFVGNDTFTLSVSDGQYQDELNVLVNVRMPPPPPTPPVVTPTLPVVINQPPVIAQGEALSVNMSEDNNPNVFSLSLTANDGNNDSLTWRIDGGPQSGSASVNGSNNQVDVSYVPRLNFFGTDSFTVSVSDGAESDSIRVNVSVEEVNDSPSISGKPDLDVEINQLYQFKPNAADVDGDKLTYSVSGAPSWLLLDTSNGVLSGTPLRKDVGMSGPIVLTVSDGNDSTSLEPFRIDVKGQENVAPSSNDMNLNGEEDVPLTIVFDVKDNNNDPLQINIVNEPEHGTVELSPSGAIYLPDENYFGSDSFSYSASDGELTSDVSEVQINLLAVNDAPQAVADNFVLEKRVNNVYLLDVLSNDKDLEGDSLNLISAEAEIGVVSVLDNQLQFQAPEDITGLIELNYQVTDNQGGSAKGQVLLHLESGEAPTITLPEDVIVTSTGLLTKVNLGVATAVDNAGSPVPVMTRDNRRLFSSGRHQVEWVAEDGSGRVSRAIQTVNVMPLVTLVAPPMAVEGSSITLMAMLNGQAPFYPFEVPVNFSGTATEGLDFSISSKTIVIASGESGFVNIELLADDVTEENETLMFEIHEGANSNFSNGTEVIITEANIAPTVKLSVSQNDEIRTLVSRDSGNVIVEAITADQNTQDLLTLHWDAHEALFNVSESAEQFVFSTEGLPAGIYYVKATVTDDASLPQSNESKVLIELVETLPNLGSEDTDGDGIVDSEEGLGDKNGNGIADYLDTFDNCNVIPHSAQQQSLFLVESPANVCLRKGETALKNGVYGLGIEAKEIGLSDGKSRFDGGLFDFEILGLSKGESVNIVLPQTNPIPGNAVYRKYRADTGWIDFVEDAENTLFSAPGVAGVCPPPGASEWQRGLVEGYWCVQLLIEDGGNNDDDGFANGMIVDPGGVATISSDNRPPLVEPIVDSLLWNSDIEIPLLSNASDDDGDSLVVLSVSVDNGKAELINNDVLKYTPERHFVGTAIVDFIVSDGKGGTSASSATLNIRGNRAPVVSNGEVLTQEGEAVSVNLLDYVEDMDGDILLFEQVTSEIGEISLLNSQVTFTPATGFTGKNTVTFMASDGYETVEGKLTITVNPKALPSAHQSSGSSGGSISLHLIFIYMMLLTIRCYSHGAKMTMPSCSR